MIELIQALLWPIVASVVLPPLLVFFGLQSVTRRELFLALTLPQLALLGGATAFVANHTGVQALAWSMGIGFIGAAFLTLVRMQSKDLPQETIIAITWLVAVAGTVLLFHRTAEGGEELKRSFLGQLLLVTQKSVVRTVVGALVIGVVVFVLRRPILEVSRSTGCNLVANSLFALAVGNFVGIGGLLMTLSYLLICPVCAILITPTRPLQWLLGCLIATASTITGLFLSYKIDLSTGCGTALVAAAIFFLCLSFSGLRSIKKARRSEPLPNLPQSNF